jgi:hypothetical protein
MPAFAGSCHAANITMVWATQADSQASCYLCCMPMLFVPLLEAWACILFVCFRHGHAFNPKGMNMGGAGWEREGRSSGWSSTGLA